MQRPPVITVYACGWQQTGHSSCEGQSNEQENRNNLLSPYVPGSGLSTLHAIFSHQYSFEKGRDIISLYYMQVEKVTLKG